MPRPRLSLAALVLITIPACGRKPPEPGELIDAALAAHGGEANVGKFPASTLTFKGKVFGTGADTPVSGTIIVAGPDRQRSEMVLETGGQKVPVVTVLAGDKGWSKVPGATKPRTPDEVAEAKEQCHAAWVATLIPLKDPAVTLTGLGESEVEGRKAWGVKVSSPGHRDVSLFFDQETNLLAKTETRVKDDSGQEVTEETYPTGYKDVQGVKQPTRFDVRRNGKRYMEGEATEVKLAEKLDPNLFTRP